MSSKISGSFDDEKYEACIHITNKLIRFLHSDDGADFRSRGRTMTVELTSHALDEAETKASTDSTDPTDSTRPVNKHHQRVLAAANIQAVLETALALNYNCVYEGSQCEEWEKQKSRDMIVHVCQGFRLGTFVRSQHSHHSHHPLHHSLLSTHPTYPTSGPAPTFQDHPLLRRRQYQ